MKLDPTPATVQAPSQLLNISTRLNVGTGNDVLIGGFIITGLDAKEIAMRAIGPSLANSGVAGPLADPILELHDSTGATVATNDNWMDLPTDPNEAALYDILPAGAYTAILSGAGGTSGVGLVESYSTD
ncbi:MAG: hypothetical protein M3Q86_11360 [Verrucomicrobiota bacterium]|nr:hypothetical protein [Verrucomicrobiota bacterium]